MLRNAFVTVFLTSRTRLCGIHLAQAVTSRDNIKILAIL